MWRGVHLSGSLAMYHGLLPLATIAGADQRFNPPPYLVVSDAGSDGRFNIQLRQVAVTVIGWILVCRHVVIRKVRQLSLPPILVRVAHQVRAGVRLAGKQIQMPG